MALRSSTTPSKLQLDAAAFLLQHPAALLHADMGAGKTLSSMLAAFTLLDMNPRLRILVVTPKAVVPAFIADVRKHFSFAPVYRHLGSNRSPPTSGLIITSFDLFHEIDAADVLVFDEAHLLRNPRTLRWNSALKLVQHCLYCWFLSGTPIVNFKKDLIALQLLSGDAELPALRIAATHVKLPDAIYHIVDTELSPAERERYAEAEQHPMPLVRSLKLRIASAFSFSKAKYISQLDGNVLVFSDFNTHSLLKLKHWLGDTERDVWFCTGQSKQITQFQRHGGILLCSYKAAGLGISLVQAHHVVLLDPAWNPATMLQAVARALRPGLQHVLHVHHLFSADTIEQHVWKVQLDKLKLY